MPPHPEKKSCPPWRSGDPALSSTPEAGLRLLLESLPGGDRAMRAARSPGKPGRPSSLPRAGGWQGSPAPFVSRRTARRSQAQGGCLRAALRLTRERDCAEAAALEREHLHAQPVAIDDEDLGVTIVGAGLDHDVRRDEDRALAFSLFRELAQRPAGTIDQDEHALGRSAADYETPVPHRGEGARLEALAARAGELEGEQERAGAEDLDAPAERLRGEQELALRGQPANVLERPAGLPQGGAGRAPGEIGVEELHGVASLARAGDGDPAVVVIAAHLHVHGLRHEPRQDRLRPRRPGDRAPDPSHLAPEEREAAHAIGRRVGDEDRPVLVHRQARDGRAPAEWIAEREADGELAPALVEAAHARRLGLVADQQQAAREREAAHPSVRRRGARGHARGAPGPARVRAGPWPRTRQCLPASLSERSAAAGTGLAS